jgi:AcrR family transcriptional regulator
VNSVHVEEIGMAGSTPRERRQAATRQRIIEAARTIIRQEGLDALSMRRLADVIDYSPSALYKYFANKDAILEAVREEALRVLSQHEPPEDITQMTPPDALYASGLAYLDFAARYPEYYDLVFNTPAIVPQDLQLMMAPESPLNELVSLLEAGIASGHFRLPAGYDSQMMAFQLWVMAHGVAMFRLKMLHEENATFEGYWQQMIRAFIDTFTVQS